MKAGRKARTAASRAGNSNTLAMIARIGFAANGLTHVLIGYLAIRVALHQGGESDQSGAFAQLLKLPGGMIVLWIIVAGLAALSLWLLLQAALGLGSSSKKRWVRSLGSLGSAVAYIAVASTALSFALRRPSDSSSSSTEASGTILSLPGGQALLIAVGLVTVGIGGYFIYKGARQKFRKDITVPSGRSERPVVVLAMTGFIAKGIAILTLGILFIVAAVQVDPKEASGLDGALKALTELPFGEAILVGVGVGLIAYGLYCFALVRLARL
ncbi:DUF1206 domain-containing protein [Arthrobacter sp. H35-D1]|uniref:DUF1206 domain-containing protein n=1 Tax=Arthrobacter sp. H35-D1 TaxID=3046202 RepID=UPI0024BBC5ED|nr:DUF1206 domain-containing protein [Arthrobacter sp. H35-D1]MDJ0313527.1 DUF1206 domain-containing protein [Arthrobacter sp. H35-D1]